MPRDERFAVSRRWKRVEIARASPRTVATLDVLGLKIPFRWHRSNPPCPGFVSALCYLRRARRPPVPPIPHVHIATSPTHRRMVETAPAEPAGLLRHLTIPVAVAVALAVGAAWYATWTSADVLMALMAASLLPSTDPAPFFARLLPLVVRLASLGIRPVRRGPHGLSPLLVLHRLLLALHARAVHIRVHEPRVDGCALGRNLHREARSSAGPLCSCDWRRPGGSRWSCSFRGSPAEVNGKDRGTIERGGGWIGEVTLPREAESLRVSEPVRRESMGSREGRRRPR